MTAIAQIYLGNIYQQPDLVQLLDRDTYLEVHLSQSDRTKGRIHAHTATGINIGIIKSRDRSIQSGDVFQTESAQLVLVHLPDEELLVLDLNHVEKNIAPGELVRLGHLLGNHHYPIAIHNNCIYVQIVTSPKAIEQLLQEINLPGLETRYETSNQRDSLIFASHSH